MCQLLTMGARDLNPITSIPFASLNLIVNFGINFILIISLYTIFEIL